jgi:Predicted transcriptional regulators
MEILKERYSITELSGILQITDHALRFYEKEFGLTVPKDSRGRRYYTTELANIMYQIKTMRNEGLEIKAIRKILQSEEVIKDPPPIVTEETQTDLIPMVQRDNSLSDLKVFFQEFRTQLTSEISNELASSRDHITREITKSKLELGACVENGMRKLETKMDKHFLDVDKAIGAWREKNKKNIFKKLFR